MYPELLDGQRLPHLYCRERRTKMRTKILVLSVVAIMGLLVFFTILTKQPDVFFSGAVALFTALLFVVNRELSNAQQKVISLQQQLLDNQRLFNDWTQEQTGRLRDPHISPHGTVRVERTDNNLGIKVTMYLSNPGDVLVSLLDMEFPKGSPLAETAPERCVWRSLHPLLSTSMNDDAHFHQAFPVPLFAGGLSEIRLFLQARTQESQRACLEAAEFPVRFGYAAAGAKIKWSDWDLATSILSILPVHEGQGADSQL
jgi:hypothetical protein